MRTISCVDGLRGLAVTLVVLFHIEESLKTLPGPDNIVRAAFSPFRFGFVGVHIFLVLSGYCLAASMMSRADAGRPIAPRAYFMARFRRIAPPYYAAMILYLGVSAAAALAGHSQTAVHAFTPKQLLSHVTFVHGLWPDTIYAINIAFWSLSLEAQFYAALPLLLALASRWDVAPMIAAVAASSLAFRAWIRLARPDLTYLEGGLFLGRWTEFALGIGVAAWYKRYDRRVCGDRLAAGLGAAAATAIGTGLLSVEFRVPIAPDFCLSLGFAALLAATLVSSDRGGRLGRSLAKRGWVALGMISYSLYLTHNLAIGRGVQLYRRLVPNATALTDAVMVLGVLTGVALLAGAFYQLIELRFVRSVDSGRKAFSSPIR
jgi:peptidoglycan/LPS O-acetylase OafA/YrhL